MIADKYSRKYWLPIEFNKEGHYEDYHGVQQRKIADANAIPEPPAPPKGYASKLYFRRKRLTDVLMKSAKCSQCSEVDLIDVFPVIRLEPCGHLCCPQCISEKFKANSGGKLMSIENVGEGIIGLKKSDNDKFWIVSNSDEFDSFIRGDITDVLCTGCENNNSDCDDLITKVCIAKNTESLFMCCRSSKSIRDVEVKENKTPVLEEQCIDEADRKVEPMSDDEDEIGTHNDAGPGIKSEKTETDSMSDDGEFDDSSECDVFNVCLKTFYGNDDIYKHLHQIHKKLPYDQPIAKAELAKERIMRYEARKNQLEAESTASRSALEGIKVLSPPPVPPPPPPTSTPTTVRLPSPVSTNPLIPPPPPAASVVAPTNISLRSFEPPVSRHLPENRYEPVVSFTGQTGLCNEAYDNNLRWNPGGSNNNLWGGPTTTFGGGMSIGGSNDDLSPLVHGVVSNSNSNNLPINTQIPAAPAAAPPAPPVQQQAVHIPVQAADAGGIETMSSDSD